MATVKSLVEQKLEERPNRRLEEIWRELAREHPTKHFGWRNMLTIKRSYLLRKKRKDSGEQ